MIFAFQRRRRAPARARRSDPDAIFRAFMRTLERLRRAPGKEAV